MISSENAQALRRAVDSFYEKNRDLDLSYFSERTPEEIGELATLELDESATAELQREAKKFTSGECCIFHCAGSFDTSELAHQTPQSFLPVPSNATTIKARITALLLMRLASAVPVAYRSENDGGLFVNLSAIPGSGRLAEKSIKSMRGHTDGVSFPFPYNPSDGTYSQMISPSPDIVCLICLRNPDLVPTKVSEVDASMRRLDGQTIQELLKQKYIIGCQNTFRSGTKKILGDYHIAENAEVFRLNTGVYEVRFSHSKVVAEEHDTQGKAALNAFEQATNDTMADLTLNPGDVVLINNRRMLHGRGRVSEGYGGETRWLLRSYAMFYENFYSDFLYVDSSYELIP